MANTKTLSITLKLPEVMLDVYNMSYLTGKSRVVEGHPELVANMQADLGDDDVAQIGRSVTKGVSTLRNELSEYLSPDSDTSADNGVLDVRKPVTLTLAMPSNFNLGVRDAVAQCCHAYVKYVALSHWFLITNKSDAGEYVQLAKEELGQLRSALSKRVRPQLGSTFA